MRVNLRLDLFQGPIKPSGEPHRCDTPFNLTPMWDQIMESSDYARRRSNVTKFNAEHKFKKRGLAVIPTGYSVGYECKWMNHGHAYVLIYEDGSVHVHHGGIEMGQGLHTKMLQVAAETLGIPIEYIHTNETTTDNIANTQATSGQLYLFQTHISAIKCLRKDMVDLLRFYRWILSDCFKIKYFRCRKATEESISIHPCIFFCEK